ncbi:MAG: hypothetical protein RMX63_34850 [Aulosira sp. ZfuCHP01]|nr:hypothetical protein [Aulosira sp. ZfuVER01]MDZ8056599.1 hypothetical protein [Aulosira sp. ZfuCHP01]
MNIPNSISLIALLLAIGGNVIWLFVTYGNSEKRKLSAERDFNHLRNNQQNISDGIAHGFDEIEDKLAVIDRNLIEVKIWIMRNVKQAD